MEEQLQELSKAGEESSKEKNWAGKISLYKRLFVLRGVKGNRVLLHFEISFTSDRTCDAVCSCIFVRKLYWCHNAEVKSCVLFLYNL